MSGPVRITSANPALDAERCAKTHDRAAYAAVAALRLPDSPGNRHAFIVSSMHRHNALAGALRRAAGPINARTMRPAD